MIGSDLAGSVFFCGLVFAHSPLALVGVAFGASPVSIPFGPARRLVSPRGNGAAAGGGHVHRHAGVHRTHAVRRGDRARQAGQVQDDPRGATRSLRRDHRPVPRGRVPQHLPQLGRCGGVCDRGPEGSSRAARSAGSHRHPRGRCHRGGDGPRGRRGQHRFADRVIRFAGRRDGQRLGSGPGEEPAHLRFRRPGQVQAQERGSTLHDLRDRHRRARGAGPRLPEGKGRAARQLARESPRPRRPDPRSRG